MLDNECPEDDKNIYRVDSGDGQGIKISAIQKKTQELLNAMNVDLLREK